MEIALYPSGKRSKKFRSILFKGLWVSRGQSPPLASFADSHPFSPFPKCSCPHRSAQRNPKYCPKRKSCHIGSALRGRPLLQVSPSFSNSPPDCWKNSPSVERTACKRFGSCEKVWESNQGANEGLCPFNPHAPFKKGSILNFLTSYFGRIFTHAGVLAVFKPRRGRLKIPVAPTGKLKLHVFPLRRAKENKHFGRFF